MRTPLFLMKIYHNNNYLSTLLFIIILDLLILIPQGKQEYLQLYSM